MVFVVLKVGSQVPIGQDLGALQDNFYFSNYPKHIEYLKCSRASCRQKKREKNGGRRGRRGRKQEEKEDGRLPTYLQMKQTYKDSL